MTEAKLTPILNDLDEETTTDGSTHCLPKFYKNISAGHTTIFEI